MAGLVPPTGSGVVPLPVRRVIVPAARPPYVTALPRHDRRNRRPPGAAPCRFGSRARGRKGRPDGSVLWIGGINPGAGVRILAASQSPPGNTTRRRSVAPADYAAKRFGRRGTCVAARRRIASSTGPHDTSAAHARISHVRATNSGCSAITPPPENFVRSPVSR